MTSTPERAEQKLVGQALRQLRERAELHQRHVAEALGMTTQAWQKYEAGEGRFSAEKIDQALDALGMSLDDLELEKSRILGRPAPAAADRRSDFVIDVYGRARAGPQGPEVYDVAEPLRRLDLRQILGRATDALEVAGDSMSPWVESGEVVLFDRERPPRRGGGCVVELVSGEAYVKTYEKSDGSTLFVRELFPEERTITFALRDVKGVYPVIFRGD